jgi:hypothetical protein
VFVEILEYLVATPGLSATLLDFALELDGCRLSSEPEIAASKKKRRRQVDRGRIWLERNHGHTLSFDGHERVSFVCRQPPTISR